MDPALKLILRIISYIGLALSIVPALLVFTGTISLNAYYNLMIVGMVLWFGAAVFWIKPTHDI